MLKLKRAMNILMCVVNSLTCVVRPEIKSASGLPEPRFEISLLLVVGAAADRIANAGRVKSEKRMSAVCWR